MASSMMFVDYVPAVLSVIISLIWFCAAISLRNDIAPLFTWSALIMVVAGSASTFLLAPQFAWFVVLGQVGISIIAGLWYRHLWLVEYHKSITYHHHEVDKVHHVFEREPLPERAVGQQTSTSTGQVCN